MAISNMLSRMLQPLGNRGARLHHLLDLILLIPQARARYNAGYFAILKLGLRLWRHHRFLPTDSWQLGLLDPALPAHELARCASKEITIRAQHRVNPASWAPLMQNKGMFYRYCQVVGIPTPRLYALLFRNTAGWSPDVGVLNSWLQWERFLQSRLPEEFVVKPDSGYHGKGVRVFKRIGLVYEDTSGTRFSASDLYDLILAHREFDGFVIQQRLTNHPDLIRLGGTPFLQTARIVTFSSPDGRCSILHALLKVIVGTNTTDNFDSGRSGNLLATASVEDGILSAAATLGSNGSGVEHFRTHPYTQVSIEGFQLPHWEQAISVVKHAAAQFLPIRTIGWDVALTADGVYIVEGNVWWDPPNPLQAMDVLLPPLLAENPPNPRSSPPVTPTSTGYENAH